MSQSQELEDERLYQAWAVYTPRSREEYWHRQATWYQARLFDAWRALRGQTKGLQRQRRLIRRLRAEIEALKAK